MDPRSENRFMDKFTVGDGCWEWTRGKFWNGYGNFKLDGRCVKAHRLAYELFVGPIPDGASVCHDCDNPACVRPSHFFLGTHRENMDDREAKGRNNPQRGEANGFSVLTSEIAREIARRSASGETTRSIARSMGLNRYTVGDVVRGRTWRHVTAA